MAISFGYDPLSTNDRSQLTEGWHPAFLVQVTEEDTPTTWQMYAKSPRRWVFHFAIWEATQHIGRQAPEHQSASTSKTFSPGGKYQPSKAYVWTCELLDRRIPPGERIDPNDFVPLPCRLKILRHDKDGNPMEYANIKDLEKWPDGKQFLTPDLHQNLHVWMQQKLAGPAPTTASPATPPVQTAPQSPPAPLSQPAPSWAAQPATAAPVPPVAAGAAKPRW
jgi:hypothetical protein